MLTVDFDGIQSQQKQKKDSRKKMDRDKSTTSNSAMP